MKPLSVLIIDDDSSERELYRQWLGRDGRHTYTIHEAENGKEGYRLLLDITPDCVLLDFLMTDRDGFEFLDTLRKTLPLMPPVIFLTGYHTNQIAEDAVLMGASYYIDKSALTPEKLHLVVSNAIEKPREPLRSPA